jgi:hypothetical protein
MQKSLGTNYPFEEGPGRKRPYVKREIFALGCAVYEIMAWKRPFAGLDVAEVLAKFAREEFLDVTTIIGEGVIRGYWTEEFESTEDVGIALKALQMDTRELPGWLCSD